LEKLLANNSITPINFMTGREEADAFESRNFVGLHQSTLKKVDVLANLATRAHDRNLKTNTTWWEMHGGYLRTIVELVMDNKVISFAASIASLIGLYFLFWPRK
jgi:hypothetical protein